MAAIATPTTQISPTRTRRKVRLIAVASAVITALAVWTLIELLLGMDVRAPGFDGSGATTDVGAAAVLSAATLASLAGWGLLALLERLTARARRVWAAAAVVGLVASLGGPMSGTGVTAANRTVLVLLHLVVAVVLIPMLYRTSAAGRTPHAARGGGPTVPPNGRRS